MKRMIRALAALGAILGYSCSSNQDVTELERDCASGDSEACSRASGGTEADQHVLWMDDEGAMPEDPAFGDFGQTQEALQITTLMGWGVPSVDVTLPDGSAHCRPGITSIGANDWQNGKMLPCAPDPYDFVSPTNCSVNKTCIFPRTNASGSQRNITWWFDRTTCAASLNQTGVDNLAAAIPQGLGILVNGTTWAANPASSLSSATLVFRCRNAADESAFTSTDSRTGIVGRFAWANTLSRLGALTPAQTVLESCPATPAVGYLTELDQIYTYDKGKIVIDTNTVQANSCGGGTTTSRNMFAALVAHEAGHFLGLMHDLFERSSRNIMYPGLLCDFASSPPNSMMPAQQRALSRMDTAPGGSATIGVTVHDDLACLIPIMSSEYTRNGDLLTAPDVAGGDFPFTDSYTYGIQTGGNHLPCDWFHTSQVCALPPSRELHWCFDPLSTNAQFRSDVLSRAGASGANPLLSTSTVGHYPTQSWKWIYHASCNDLQVKVVIGGNACGGSGSKIENYVCITLPPPDAGNIFTAFDSAPFGPLPGTYYSWGAHGGYAVMNLDANDINSSIASGQRGQVLSHAIRMGLGWLAGLGSRGLDPIPTNTTDMEDGIAAWIPGLSGHDQCRGDGYHETYGLVYNVRNQYCGTD